MNNIEIQFLHEVDMIKKSNKSIVLFGATLTGVLANKVIKSFNMNVSCFMDNDFNKVGTFLTDKKVISPTEGLELHRDSKIIICINTRKNYEAVKEQLTEMGYSDIMDHAMLIYMYHVDLMKRAITPRDYVKTLTPVEVDKETTILNHTLVILTDQCTLNCKQCGHLVPYYKKPQHYEKHQIIQSIKNLANSVDRIELLSLLGGEPLLHPDLVEICREISKISNIKYIRIVTNGTIVPSNETLNEIKHSITYFSVSDYGKYSFNKHELLERLTENDILFEVQGENTNWFPIFIPQKNKTQEESLRKYQTCVWGRGCSAVQNGEFHICNYSATGMRLGYIPKEESDYVDLLNNELMLDELKLEVKRLINREFPVVACEYCNFMFDEQTERAEQMSRIGE